MLDIKNQLKQPTITISANATNCFDRMAYPFAALACRYFRLQVEYIMILFKSIQIIRMYLMTCFRVSSLYYTETSTKPFQGGIQGSSSAGAN